jgi:hypothetical protein
MDKKLADIHFEVLKTPAYSLDLAPLDYYIFLTSRNISMEESFQAVGKPH